MTSCYSKRVDKDEQVRQIKKLLHRLDSGTNVDAGELFENPTNTYVDPILAEQEREVFLKEHPNWLGCQETCLKEIHS